MLLNSGLIMGAIGLAPANSEAQTTKIILSGGNRPPAPEIQISQVPFPTPALQGDQMVVNGRTVPANWMQLARTGRFAVTDAWATRAIGLNLLNNSTPTLQPIEWFTQVNLPAQIAGSLRYLDLTDLASQSGWQMQPSGRSLIVSTPAANVTGVRQGKQSWGDRLVIQLDRPTPWQVDQLVSEFVLTLDAQTAASVAQQIKFTPGNRVQSIKLEPAGPQTRLRLALPTTLRPRVFSLSNPSRIVIDVRPDSMVDRDIQWAPGIRWRSQILSLGANRFPVVWLELNPRQPGLTLRPITPNNATVTGIAPLSRTALANQANAAINGVYFNRNNQLPLGAIRQNSRWLSGPILGRGAIAWNSPADIQFSRLALQERVTTSTGQSFPLTHLNSAYAQAGIARYTPDWGPTYTNLLGDEILVSVQNDQVIDQRATSTPGSTTVPIPPSGYLLVLRSNRGSAPAFTPGTMLRLDSATDPPAFGQSAQILGAGPLLLQNRQIVLDPQREQFSKAFISELASRSAIGQTADGTLLIVAVHKRVDGPGASLNDIAQIMQQLGAVNALNLDGGSSTTLYLGGQLIDRLPVTAARVHNGLGIFVGP
jgi:hypothetical protein